MLKSDVRKLAKIFEQAEDGYTSEVENMAVRFNESFPEWHMIMNKKKDKLLYGRTDDPVYMKKADKIEAYHTTEYVKKCEAKNKLQWVRLLEPKGIESIASGHGGGGSNIK